MDAVTGTTLLLLGLLLGAGGGWALAGSRARARIAEAARAAEAATTMLRTDAAGLRAERAGLAQRVEALEMECSQAREGRRAAESAAAGAAAGRAAVEAALRAEREAGAAREDLLARRDTELKESFRALSADALARNNEQFVALAEGRLREVTATLAARADGDDADRGRALGALLDPVAATLARVEGQLRTVEKDRESAYAALREQVQAMHRSSRELQGETRRLVDALRAPQVRGRWGEVQLERLVQLAGMVEHCDFTTQVVATGPDGGVRPDMVVHLAGGKQVVVDAKVPFAAYLEAVEARDPAVRSERLTAHARQLRQHVDALSAKEYWAVFEPSPEFVVLFVPGDPFLDAALQGDPALLEHAFAADVVIATPTTLIALLRTVAHTWRQETLARGAAQVHQLGRELHGRLGTLGSHVAKLGRSLDAAVAGYNQTVSSLESRVLVTARRFADLRVADGELDAPAQVERISRRLSAPELLGPEREDPEHGRPDQAEGERGSEVAPDERTPPAAADAAGTGPARAGPGAGSPATVHR